MKTTKLVTMTCFVAFLISCAGAEYNYDKAALEEAAYASEDMQTEQPPMNEVVIRKLVKTAELKFESTNVAATRARIDSVVERLGATIYNETQTSYANRVGQRLQIRIQSTHFDSLLNLLAAPVHSFVQRDVNVSDVTGDYIDLVARIKTKKEMEFRYQALLSRAQNVREILEIEREIGALRTELESIEARLQNLTGQVALSTINIEFWQEQEVSPHYGSRFSSAFEQGLEIFIQFFIALLYLWPFMLVSSLLIIWFFVRRKRSSTSLR